MNKLIENLKAIVVKSLEVPEQDLLADDGNDLVPNENSGRQKTGFLIVYDELTPLARTLFQGYSAALPTARKLDYYAHTQEQVIEAVHQLKPGDLVILIESGSFRMSNFRWRLNLFNLKMKVIEHAHLKNNLESEHDNYLDTLNYDEEYWRTTAEYLCKVMGPAKEVRVVSQDDAGEKYVLTYTGPFEDVKKNIGDFRKMHNKGCGFPIGEVFTETGDLPNVNGQVAIYAFADIEHKTVFMDKPFVLDIRGSQLQMGPEKFAELDLTPGGRKFLELFSLLRTENSDGIVWTRELGLGLNRGISREKRLTDVSAYERVCGVHMSLGLKHDIYREKSGNLATGEPRVERYHVDTFPAVKEVWVDDVMVFADGQYIVG